MISFEEMNQELQDQGAVMSASELHGHFCGRLVVGHQIVGAMGIKIARDCLGLSPEEIAPLEGTLSEFVVEISGILENDLFSFRLLLPSDDEELGLRMQGLSDWCQGFLSGIASSAGLGGSGLMQEENETIADLVEISQISLDVDEEDNNETLFLEVSEYVRLAVFNLFDQFRIQDGEPVSTGVDLSIH